MKIWRGSQDRREPPLLVTTPQYIHARNLRHLEPAGPFDAAKQQLEDRSTPLSRSIAKRWSSGMVRLLGLWRRDAPA